MYVKLLREAPEFVDTEKALKCIVESDLRVETEALICVAQEQASRINHLNHYIILGVVQPKNH